MGHFNWLPKVDRFCWCTRNLKCASFIIAVLGMLSSIHTAGMLCRPACKELFAVSSPVRRAADVFRWMLFILEMFLISCCFLFILGIFWSLPLTADILTGCVLITCLISVIYVLLMIIQEQYTNCRWYYSQIFHMILYFIMWSYFVIIINSYEKNMS